MADSEKRNLIGYSRELTERGRGIRFLVRRHGRTEPAFAIRFQGKVHGYLNRCAHRSLELDWAAGEFFDAFGDHLLCATHGARYAPGSGVCVGGTLWWCRVGQAGPRRGKWRNPAGAGR